MLQMGDSDRRLELLKNDNQSKKKKAVPLGIAY